MNTDDPLAPPVLNRPDWPLHAPGVVPILVGVTFDESGAIAVRKAFSLALGSSKVVLHLAHVLVDAAPSNRTGKIEHRRDELEKMPAMIQSFAREHAPPAQVAVGVHVRIGEPVETLLQLALDYDCELLVVGAHRRTGIARLVQGSVSEKLVHAARLPVLIATERHFEGMSKSVIPDPVCPECAAARAATGGKTLWCETHGRDYVRNSIFFDNSEWLPQGGHDPGLIP